MKALHCFGRRCHSAGLLDHAVVLLRLCESLVVLQWRFRSGNLNMDGLMTLAVTQTLAYTRAMCLLRLGLSQVTSYNLPKIPKVGGSVASGKTKYKLKVSYCYSAFLHLFSKLKQL